MSRLEPENSYVAAIIAGGGARRLQGLAPQGLKTLLPLAEHGSILAFLVDFLTTQTPSPEAIALNIHPEQQEYTERWLDAQSPSSRLSLLRQSLVLDDVAHSANPANLNREGPMSGIAAALMWKKQHHPHVRWLLSISGDSVELPSDLLSRLLGVAANNPKTRWIVAASAERLQPPIALWHEDIVDKVLERYADGERKIDRIAKAFPYQQVVWTDCNFCNINFPDQLS